MVFGETLYLPVRHSRYQHWCLVDLQFILGMESTPESGVKIKAWKDTAGDERQDNKSTHCRCDYLWG